MDDKELKIVKRVLKKLSALRQTLRNDEARVLDLLIFGEEEVTLHAAAAGAQSRVIAIGGAASGAASGAAARVSTTQGRNKEAAAEVTMHRLATSGKASSGAQPRVGRAQSRNVLQRTDSSASEVNMHSLNPAGAAAGRIPQEAAANRAARGASFRIALSTDGNYAVTEVTR